MTNQYRCHYSSNMVLFEFALVEAAIKSGLIRSGVPEQPPQALEAAKLLGRPHSYGAWSLTGVVGSLRRPAWRSSS